MATDEKYEELIGKYMEFREKKNQIEEQMDLIRKEIDFLMHEDQVNNRIIFVRALEKECEAQYVDTERRSTNYTLLAEIVSSEVFNQIVETNKTTSLRISYAKKKKEKKSKPVEDQTPIKAKVPQAKLVKE